MNIDDSKLIKILTIGIVAACIVAVILIVLVWKINIGQLTNKEIPVTEGQPIGNFIYKSYNREDALNKYINKMSDCLYNADIDQLYELLSTDYKNKFSYTKESLYGNLRGKNAFGKKYKETTYEFNTLLNKRIFSVAMVSEDSSVSFNITIIEESPNKYSYSLDNYIMEVNAETNQSINGLNLNIKSITYYTDRIVTRAKLTNSNDYTVYLNTQNKSESAYYRINDIDGDIDIVTKSVVFSGGVKQLNPNSDIEITFDSNISFSNFSAITTIVIKDVKLSENGVQTELVYNF